MYEAPGASSASHSRRAPKALLAAAVISALAACSDTHQSTTPTPPAGDASARIGASPAGASGSSPAPFVGCKITSWDRAAAAFGARSVIDTTSDNIAGTYCRYHVPIPNTLGVPGTIALTMIRPATMDKFEELRKNTGGAVPVLDVGQRAFYLTSGSTLWLINENTVVVIGADFKTADAAKVQAATVALGKAVASG